MYLVGRLRTLFFSRPFLHVSAQIILYKLSKPSPESIVIFDKYRYNDDIAIAVARDKSFSVSRETIIGYHIRNVTKCAKR